MIKSRVNSLCLLFKKKMIFLNWKAIEFFEYLIVNIFLLFNFNSYVLAQSCCTLEYIRIVKQFVSAFPIQCPLVSSTNQINVTPDQIYWVNEDLTYTIPSTQIAIATNNIIDRSKLQILANQNMNFVSCGYLNNGLYIRLKLWRLLFIGKFAHIK